MAYTLTVEPDDDGLGWLLFIDHRPVMDFNRDLQAFLNLDPGSHRLVVDARGAGSTVKIKIDGNAQLITPAGGWPLTVTVPKNKTGLAVVAEFSV